MGEAWAIGLDLGGTNIKAAAVSAEGRLLSNLTVPTGAEGGVEAVLHRLSGAAARVKAMAGLNDPPEGVGIGIPGSVLPAEGLVVLAPNLGWKKLKLGGLLESLFPYPLYLENDAGAAAWGEQWKGMGQGRSNLLLVTVGTGIGSGLVLGGRLYRGAGGRGTELGHWKVGSGIPCGCGGRGCLETVAAAPAILREAGRAIKAGQRTALRGVGHLTLRSVVEFAERGDSLAREVLASAATRLGGALAGAATFLGLETIAVGGGVAQAGEIYLEPLKREFEACGSPYTDGVLLGAAELGNEAGVVGAAALVLRHEEKALYRGNL